MDDAPKISKRVDVGHEKLLTDPMLLPFPRRDDKDLPCCSCDRDSTADDPWPCGVALAHYKRRERIEEGVE
jgi:hypothetical protein